jgi:hypothetical protein
MHTNFGGKYERKRQIRKPKLDERIIYIVSLTYKMGGCGQDYYDSG